MAKNNKPRRIMFGEEKEGNHWLNDWRAKNKK